MAAATAVAQAVMTAVAVAARVAIAAECWNLQWRP
jgi:hypothetical protein